jgi:hypothetical protein
MYNKVQNFNQKNFCFHFIIECLGIFISNYNKKAIYLTISAIKTKLLAFKMKIQSAISHLGLISFHFCKFYFFSVEKVGCTLAGLRVSD